LNIDNKIGFPVRKCSDFFAKTGTLISSKVAAKRIKKPPFGKWLTNLTDK
jgi:hypothetical protein